MAMNTFGSSTPVHFLTFLPREKTLATVFQAFSRGRKRQRRFFKLSPAGENVSDGFSSFLPREKTPATIFQAFSRGRKCQQRFFKLSPAGENISKINSSKNKY
jgi:hypothetical protein